MRSSLPVLRKTFAARNSFRGGLSSFSAIVAMSSLQPPMNMPHTRRPSPANHPASQPEYFAPRPARDR